MRNRIIVGDAIEELRKLPEQSVHCVVTSPPYWGLRDYGVDGQIGLEETPEEMIERLVLVFREVWRVLRDDGTLWLNMGDTYAASHFGAGGKHRRLRKERDVPIPRKVPDGIKPKDLIGVPWMLAFALRADGWYLRRDIIWSKPNPMPESAKDRPTTSHEYIFLLSKKPRYFFDMEAIKEVAAYSQNPWPGGWETEGDKSAIAFSRKKSRRSSKPKGSFNGKTGNKAFRAIVNKRKKRSVWEVATRGFPEAHFATFPEKLIEPCILAGCPAQVCKKCGQPRERIVKRKLARTKKAVKKNVKDSRDAGADRNDKGSNWQKDGHLPGMIRADETIGWTTCECHAGYEPGTVLDPFLGSGTTSLVAMKNNRYGVGIDLNPEYAMIARKRLRPWMEQRRLDEVGK